MIVDVGNRLFNRHDLTVSGSRARLFKIRGGPTEIAVVAGHEFSDRSRDGLLDRGEAASSHLLLKPFLLVRGQSDVHTANINGAPAAFQSRQAAYEDRTDNAKC